MSKINISWDVTLCNLIRLDRVTSQKIIIFIFTAVITFDMRQKSWLTVDQSPSYLINVLIVYNMPKINNYMQQFNLVDM
jgi:hypothetical protein